VPLKLPYTQTTMISDDADQDAAVNVCANGKNVFITGPAGTGKSYTLKRIRHQLVGLRVVVGAPTGISAVIIGGKTIYAAFKIHPKELLTGKVRQNKIWLSVDVLIIDEISMISLPLWKYMDAQAKLSRNINEPMGGVQLIVMGDFFQLPPVNKRGSDQTYVFESALWKNLDFQVIELKTVHRQDGGEFIELLMRIRTGTHTKSDIQTLLATKLRVGDDNVDTGIEPPSPQGLQVDQPEENNEMDEKHNEDVLNNALKIVPTTLFCRNINVDTKNARHLAQIQGDVETFDLIAEFLPSPSCTLTLKQQQTMKDKILKDSVCFGSSLNLKVGAQVMLTANVSVDSGLCNGARGVVIGFTGNRRWPVVKFLKIGKCVIRSFRWVYDAGKSGEVQVVAIPLRLAWAITIHKSQGQTIDLLDVDLRDCFAPGQAYTALSRARSLGGLRVFGMNNRCVRVDPKVLAFYQTLGEDN
jgi:ATP-dependent DNA helicase PIF1